MITDKEARTYYELWDDSNSAESVNESFTMIQDHLKTYGLKTANDDRAENLITAITRYILESGNFAL